MSDFGVIAISTSMVGQKVSTSNVEKAEAKMKENRYVPLEFKEPEISPFKEERSTVTHRGEAPVVSFFSRSVIKAVPTEFAANLIKLGSSTEN